MQLGRIVTAVLAAGIGAVGLAGPATATDDITENALGTYKVDYTYGSYIWTAVPCEDAAPQCVRITQYGPKDVKLKYPNWSANAYWSVGSWIIQGVNTPAALRCKEDGSSHDAPVNYSWDADTNTGYKSFFDPGICNGKAQSRSNPFTVTKTGPAPGSD